MKDPIQVNPFPYAQVKIIDPMIMIFTCIFQHCSGSKRFNRRRRDSQSLVNGDASQLAKLPAVDSDEEDELIQLTSNKQPNNLTSTDHLGREHPFSPMVNRDMLGNLVRRAFHQTEEQQTTFEQILKHEYGRRSKGEVGTYL